MKKEDKLLVMWTSAAIGTLVPVALYQLAVISHLPDPPSKVFASDEITASSMAHPFGIPDSLPGLCSYGTTLALVLAAGSQPSLQRILKLKLMGDGSFAALNTLRQVTRFGRLCSWCMGTVFCTAGMLVSGRGRSMPH